MERKTHDGVATFFFIFSISELFELLL